MLLFPQTISGAEPVSAHFQFHRLQGKAQDPQWQFSFIRQTCWIDSRYLKNLNNDIEYEWINKHINHLI